MTRDLRNTIKRTRAGSWIQSTLIIVVLVTGFFTTKHYWDYYKDPNSFESYFGDPMNKRDHLHRFIDWIREEP
jgi:hypothetical protein